MKTELAGWVSAISAAASSFWATLRDHRTPDRRIPGAAELHRERGFTLTELMVSLAIVGILAGTAAPPLMDMIATQRVRTATFDFVAAVGHARNEAITRSSVVTIAPHAGGFANGYDLQAGGEIVMSELGRPGVAVDAHGGGALAFDSFGRLTTTPPYQVGLSSTVDSGIAMRCIEIGSSGRPSMRVDNDHDGNCIYD